MDDKTRKLIVNLVFRRFCARGDTAHCRPGIWCGVVTAMPLFREKHYWHWTVDDWLTVWCACPAKDKPAMPAELESCLQSSTN